MTQTQKSYLIDMDGVLLKGSTPIPGADAFLERLERRSLQYLVLTNNPVYTQNDLAYRLSSIGLTVPPLRIFTSAIATVSFLKSQRINGKVFVILGETLSYNFQLVTTAIRLIGQGARFIATNPDPSGPGEGGLVPACGAMAAMNFLGVHSENTVMIGDRMDTDIVAGVESGMETVLVLSDVTHRDEIHRFPYQPGRVLASVAEIDP